MLTLGEVGEFLRASAARAEGELEALVVETAAWAAVEARGYVGHLQPEWPALSDATIEGFTHAYGFYIKGKRELGFASPDFEPLLRTGQGQDSIEAIADGLTGGVVSDDPIMLYQEMGTPNARYPIPPRPTMALAVKKAMPTLLDEMEQLAVSLLLPED